MISIVLLAALIGLALLTQAGVAFLQRSYPQRGEPVEVDGARLNVVDLGPRHSFDPPIVLVHGASSNLEVMRWPLGERLAERYRVILIDRPGHGWSARNSEVASTPDVQARMIADALEKLGIGRAILVVHSWSGALGARLALDAPDRLAGLVMLAPVTHPWRGGVGGYNKLVTTPVIGRLLAHTITLPLGLLLAKSGARNVFLPQSLPDGFLRDSATPLLLRPHEFLANARDLVTLKPAVIAQAPRYGEIRLPVTILAGDVDKTVSTEIHARAFARAVPQTRLVLLEGVGHMVQQAVPERVIAEIEAMMGEVKSVAL
ncbi:MAG TPA: alpha/beta hydrolase [Bradyrhizobium sp.]|jgi:pimeloyl-ACP methyl ester carboxylesterase|nr:alpha/beta hydrolase [Bradyrhizobium sp.]